MGHMSKVDDSISSTNYYFPHHGVLKEDSLTTKLRVVFDGSCSTSSGLSINDLQMVGPVIQSDLLSILLRFRKHTYVVSADITKMYRQVFIHPSQRNLQRILWRNNPSEILNSYSLNTVTYGASASSFLATRCLIQLSHDNCKKFPQASRIIANDFYVDDLLTGSNSISELISHCQQVSQILSEGCFPLRKWISNSSSVLNSIKEVIHSSDSIFTLGQDENVKTLGLQWHPKSDFLLYSINSRGIPKTITKRTILSGIAQIFDPLGLLSASVIKVKILMQQLWLENLGWDQSVPLHIHTQWINFRNELSQLNDLRISRHVILKNASDIELHGFCDASELAYGAVIYIRSIDKEGNVAVNLLCSKTKVSPLKKITVPRLELCGALILSRLAKLVLKALEINFSDIHFWTDSSIVLGWIKTSPHILKTFVANRVSEITSNTSSNDWRHVGTRVNPADLLSRGIDLCSLKSSDLWWHGPPFLLGSSETWPIFNVCVQELPELKPVNHSMLAVPSEPFHFETFSSLTTLNRVIAYCLRFYHNSSNSGEHLKFSGSLTIKELQNSIICIIKMVQKETFSFELQILNKNLPLPKNSKILSLNPFLDKEGIIRVGGRLRNSKFNYDKKHPILLPSHHHFTILLFRSEHLKLFHAGPQHLLSVIRERYWPIYGRSTAKKVVRECIQCFRANPTQPIPIMGDLPSSRVSLSFPFSVTGIDYAGPFLLKTKYGRNPSLYKGYVSLFVCLSTKAIHLELVTDLTKDSFLSALKRFIARRGKPAQIMSDNGTNFVGSHNELKDLGNFLKSNEHEINDICFQNDINWQFIPAHSPHFGGIWEAGVKSMKAHLKRVISNTKLTYEDFMTIFIQVEGILNSRPLTPLSSDPSDFLSLTPSHFLIGRSASSVPDVDLTNINLNKLSRYQQLQQLRQHFWQRWSLEYISELQQRQKWKINCSNIKTGCLVLVKEKGVPPLNWILGRVEQLHSGADGITRVVTLKTSKGVLRRAVQTICPVPG